MRIAIVAAFLLTLVLTGSSCALFLPDSGFEPGQFAPEIALPSLADGSPLSLADFRGEKVVLHVFASW